MATIVEMAARWQEFRDSLISVAGGAITNQKEAVLEVIRGQLLEGKDSEGNYLSPKYSEDPYFKKPGAAQRYAAFKKRMFPGDRPEDVPNLIITGVFHDAIDLNVSDNTIEYSDSASFADSVLGKFGDKILGLNSDGKKQTWQIIRPEIMDSIVETTGCTVS